MRKLVLTFAAIWIVNSSLAQISELAETRKIQWKNKEMEYLANELRVKVLKGYTIKHDSLLASLGAVLEGEIDRWGWGTIRLPEGSNDLEMIAQISRIPAVELVEPHLAMRDLSEPTDAYFKGVAPATYAYQWGLKNLGQNPPSGTSDADIDAPEAWNISTGGENAIIAILDSGIPMQNGVLSHPDLDYVNKIILGPDLVDPGQANGVMDQRGHGTHVAGIAAAESNNLTGIAGVAWNCRLLIIQVFNLNGLSSSAIFKNAIDYVINYKRNNPTVRIVVNYSGASNSGSDELRQAVDSANANNIVIVSAAGNGWDPDGSYIKYPAHYSEEFQNVIAVGATDQNDTKAPFSDTGAQLSLTAPGGYVLGATSDARDIFSTIPNYTTVLYPSTSNYGYLGGTSMATPHVTGAVGLMLSLDSSLTPQQIRNILQSTADDKGPSGFDSAYGYGRLNAYKALLAVAPEVTSPVSCAALTPGTQVTISWKSNTSGRTFEIRLSTDGGQTWPTLVQSSVTSGTTDYSYTWTVPSMTANDCKLKITDMNGTGYSNKSCAFGINTAFIPATPTNFSLSNNGGHPELKWEVVPDAAGYYLWRASSQYNPPYTWYKFKTLVGNGWSSLTDQLVTISNPNPYTIKYKMESYTACSVVSPQTSELSINYSEFLKRADHPVAKIQQPFTFDMSQNYPNPFNPETAISFELPEPSHVRVTVSDILGRKIVDLVDGEFSEGYQKVTWKGIDGSGTRVGSGVYFYRIIVTGQSGKQFTKVMKMALTK